MKLLDNCFALNHATTIISIYTALLSKLYQTFQDMPKYVDEFEYIFVQLERMGTETNIIMSFKAPKLLESMGNDSALEIKIAAICLNDALNLTWEALTADLITEGLQIKD